MNVCACFDSDKPKNSVDDEAAATDPIQFHLVTHERTPAVLGRVNDQL